jgi:16S rRNA (uracil1498-N3)-methyltransferase
MKSPPRFVISDNTGKPGDGGTLRVTGSELHHMRHVMRLTPGSVVVLCGANGRQYAGRISAFEPNAAIITVGAERYQQRTDSPGLILAAGMIKAARMDLLIEKAAELNAAEFWPLICTRSILREASSGRRERWRRISLAAAKQSQRAHPMEVYEPVDMGAIVNIVPKTALAVTCMVGAQPLSTVIHRMISLKNCRAVVLAVGPEGDFTTEEIALMREAGFVAAGLGSNRLRSETASLAALSIANGVLAELQDSERHLE